MTASSFDIKAFADVAAVINDCNEVIEKELDPLNEILAEIEEAKDFTDELKLNGIISFLKIDG